MSSHNDENSGSDEDSAPMAVSFKVAKSENIEQLQKMKDQITSIRESQKKKRVERQEKYIEQKKKKFDNLMLADDILDAIGDSSATRTEKSETAKISSAKKVKKNQIKKFEDEDLNETALSDFIPLRTFSKYGVSVVSLASTDKKPLIGSDKARSFKNIMFNRGVRRQTASESIALAKKRRLVK